MAATKSNKTMRSQKTEVPKFGFITLPTNADVPPTSGFIVIVAFSLTMAALLVAAGNAPVAVVSSTYSPDWHLYISRAANYQLHYPLNWHLDNSLGSAATGDTADTIVFRRGSKQVVVRTEKNAKQTSLFPEATESFSLNGASATKLHDVDETTGQPIDRVVVSRPDGQFNEIIGSGKVFSEVVDSFRLRPIPVEKS